MYGQATTHNGQLDLSISASNAIVSNQEELDQLTKTYFIEEIASIGTMCTVRPDETVITSLN